MIKQRKIKPIPDMDLEDIRNEIVYKLHKFLNVPVVNLDQIPKKPPYPFLTYKFIVAYNTNGQRGFETQELVDSRDNRFEHDIEQTLHLQPQMTLSLNAYSLDEMESSKLAQKAMDWFKHSGYYDLKYINVVVVSTEAFGNRNTLIVDDYEKRTGVDIILRTSDKIKRIVETIEKLQIEDKEYDL